MKKNPILQVLGGGRLQKKLIKQAEDEGIKVVVVDRDPEAPGKEFASFAYDVSATDFDKNLSIAKELCVDGIVTLGTDQTVVVAARIAHKLSLPSFITPETALLATNKKLMKRTLFEHDIPTARHVVICHEDSDAVINNKIEQLQSPFVVKPSDSQGQRGVSLLHDKKKAFSAVSHARSYSRDGDVIVEEYVYGYEVTANAWVSRGRINLLALTDRVTYYKPPIIGICLSHIFPSEHGRKHLTIVKEVLSKTVKAFHIDEGPLYVQMIVSDSKVFIVELACRIGGGHEEDLIPSVSGIDVRQCLIDFALGRRQKAIRYDFNYTSLKEQYGVFFLAPKRHDTVSGLIPLSKQVTDECLLWGEFYIKEGSKVNSLTIATDRIGAFLAKGADRQALLSNADNIIKRLVVEGEKYKNIISDIFALPLKGL